MEQLRMYLFQRNNRVHCIKKNSMITVSYFQNRRWRIITLLEKLSGWWPYQSKMKQYPLRLIGFYFFFTIFLSVTNKLTEYVGVDIYMTIECCLATIFLSGLFVKILFGSLQPFHKQRAYEIVVKHFETMSDPEEAAILNEAAERGFIYALLYICGVCLIVGIYGGIPILRSFYQYFFDHCELDVQLPLPMNFGINHRKYWHILTVNFLLWICTNLVITFAFDLSFMLQVRHAAALFQIVGIRLRKVLELVDESKNEVVSDDAAEESYSLMSSAIDLHSECFEVVKLIEKSYMTSWFVILLLSTGGFGAGVHLISTKLHDPIETFRYVSGFILILAHFQMIFSQGQMIINSNSTVSDACCECKWYSLPKKSCQQLTMMLIRTSMPCILTGAKLFPLSMESFSKMLKAGLSYYTVFKTRS